MSKEELLKNLDAEILWWEKANYKLQRKRMKRWGNLEIVFTHTPYGNPETIKQLLKELA